MSKREYKSSVFTMLEEVPEYALDTYNALNGTNYTDPSIVKIQKLGGKILLSVRNDACIEEGAKKFPDFVTDKSLLKLPLRDGNEIEEDAYKDKYFINASSVIQPQIVDRNLKFILDHDAIYPGVFARVSLKLYTFNKCGSMGVGCGLLNIQKVADGDRLVGIRSTAQEDFTVLEESFLD